MSKEGEKALVVRPEQALVGLKYNLVPGGGVVPLGFKGTRVFSPFLMDYSGSMKKFGRLPLELVNQHLDDLAQDKSVCHLTGVVGFNSTTHVLVPLSPIQEARRLSVYEPDGSTLLYGTVDSELRKLLGGWESAHPVSRGRTRVVVGVMSDGEDTDSDKKIYPAQLQATSAECIKAGWILLAFGIGIDGQQLARDLGFPIDRAETHQATAEGLREATRSFRQTTQTWSR